MNQQEQIQVEQLHMVVMETEQLLEGNSDSTTTSPIHRIGSDSNHHQQQERLHHQGERCSPSSCCSNDFTVSRDQQEHQHSLLQMWQRQLLPLARPLDEDNGRNCVGSNAFDLRSSGDSDTRFPSNTTRMIQMSTAHSTSATLAGVESKYIFSPNDVTIGDLIASGSFASVYKVSLNTSLSHHHHHQNLHHSAPTIGSHRSLIQVTSTRNDNHNPSVPTAFTRQQDELLFHMLQYNQNNNDDYEMEDYINFDTPRMVSFSSGSRHSYSHSMNNSSTTPTSILQKPFVLKRLNAIVLNTPAKVHHGIKGMRFEAQLLSETDHPNIVRMYGMSYNFENNPTDGFLILEYLVETLDHRLLRWMNRQSMMRDGNRMNRNKKNGDDDDIRSNGGGGKLHLLESCQRFLHMHDATKSNKKNSSNNISKKWKNTTMLREQLTRTKYIAYGIANALAYLHDQHVLYRDLKPSNVGFDGNGTVKLFDFDLSRRYCPSNINNEGDVCIHHHMMRDEINDTSGQYPTGRKLTGCIGSLRYMSPECAQGKPYSFSTDVHSFGILLWEICCIQRPYSHITSSSSLAKNTFIGHERPPLRNKIASPMIKQLLQKCWNPNPIIRPTMSDVVDTLRSIQQYYNDSNNHMATSMSGRGGGSPTLRKLISIRKNG